MNNILLNKINEFPTFFRFQIDGAQRVISAVSYSNGNKIISLHLSNCINAVRNEVLNNPLNALHYFEKFIYKTFKTNCSELKNVTLKLEYDITDRLMMGKFKNNSDAKYWVIMDDKK